MANEKPKVISSTYNAKTGVTTETSNDTVQIPKPTDAPEILAVQPQAIETPEPSQEPQVTSAPVILDQQQATVTTLDSMIEAIKQSNNMPAKFVVMGLERYIETMKPNLPVSKSDVVTQQTSLWKTLLNFVENTEEDFDKTFSCVLGLFLKHKDDVFHEHYVFRMMSDVTLDKEEINAFQAMINLLKVTADPVGRQAALKQNVDISRTLANVFSENARQKILSFYGM